MRTQNGCRQQTRSHEDYAGGVSDVQDYARFKADCDTREETLKVQLTGLEAIVEEVSLLEQPWVKYLLAHQTFTQLDRTTLAEIVEVIWIFEDGQLKIAYKIEIPDGLS